VKTYYPLTLFLILLTTLAACKKETFNKFTDTRVSNITDQEVPDSVKINQLQYIGSHNSYKIRPDRELLDLLSSFFQNSSLFDVSDMDYTHLPFEEQFTYYGVRQIEIDFYADADGGRFYSRKGAEMIGKNPESGIPQLLQPGNKVLHIADIDYETHYYTLIESFQAVKRWSDQHPYHLPIFILLETKTETVANTLPGLGFAESEPWDAGRINNIETEIRAVFDESRIITPDFVRGSYATLNEAIMDKGWPTVGECRGKVMFMFDQTNINSIYMQGSPSLEGKLVFTDSNPGEPHAAFIKRNNVSSSDIQNLVEQGYLVRTMIGGTREARTGDYSKWNLGLSKGAHFLSTDYYRPDERHRTSSEWTDFHVQFVTGSYRYNPITHP
jgi:hypothetical protein